MITVYTVEERWKKCLWNINISSKFL